MNQFLNTRDPADLWLNAGIFERVLLVCVTPLDIEQGGHKPGKLREFEKLSESRGNQGNLNFCRKPGKLGKMKSV